ncbi:MAG: hypothetical protein J6V54_06030 [Bacteroidales bacterium]|nr:hypothetical protein [Bacteroidales bacterium]
MKKLFTLVVALSLYAISSGQGMSLRLDDNSFPNMLESSSIESMMETSPLSSPSVLPKHIEFKHYGPYCVTDIAMAYDFTEKVFLKGINISGGWQWRRQSGFGIGVSYLADGEGVFSQMPIYAELRTHYLRNQVTPYTSLTAGYTIPMGKKNNSNEFQREVIGGGVMIGMSVGARYAFNRNVAINAYVGYQLQSLIVRRVQNADLDTDELDYSKMEESIIQHMIKFGFGVNF